MNVKLILEDIGSKKNKTYNNKGKTYLKDVRIWNYNNVHNNPNIYLFHFTLLLLEKQTFHQHEGWLS